MSHWKCFHCNPTGHAFESEDPTCPNCGAGHPAVVPMVLVHYLYRDKDGPITGMHGFKFRSACDPANGFAMKGGLAPHTDQPGAVTCPRCKAADRYKRDASFDKQIGPRAGITADAKDCCP